MNESLEEYLAYEEIDEDIYWSDWGKNPTDLDFEDPYE